MTLSVIIPCYPPHQQYLESMIEQLNKQTRIPDEICIGLSEVTTEESDRLTIRLQELTDIPLILVNDEKKARASVNRNNASLMATGDYFIYMDADDEYHPQFIEIIESVFINKNADCIMFEYGKMMGTLDINVIEPITSVTLFENTFPKAIRNIDSELSYTWSPIILAGIEQSEEYKGRGACHGIVAVRGNIWLENPQPDFPGREDAIWIRDILWSWHTNGRKTPGVLYLPIQIVKYSKQEIYSKSAS